MGKILNKMHEAISGDDPVKNIPDYPVSKMCLEDHLQLTHVIVYNCVGICGSETGSLVLLLKRIVMIFRSGSKPLPVIPVDVVSRVIVHSAFGWRGTSEPPCGSLVASSASRESPERWRGHDCDSRDVKHLRGLPSGAEKHEEVTEA